MQPLALEIIKEHHVEQASHILTKNFISQNPIWKRFQLSYNQIYTIFRGKLLKALEQDMTFVLLQNGKMIGVTVQIDLIDYLKLPSMPNHLQFFKKLDQVGAQLQSHIKLQKQTKGHAVYGLYGVIDPQFANKGYSLRFWWQCMAVGKEAGWKYYYSRISNIYSLKLLQKLGAEIIAEADLVDQDRKQKFWMVRVDFSKPLPSFTKLKQMLAKDKLKEKKPLPKL